MSDNVLDYYQKVIGFIEIGTKQVTTYAFRGEVDIYCQQTDLTFHWQW